MVPITGVHHLSLTVTNLSRSIDWYRDVFGFSLDTEFDAAGFRRARLRHPSSGFTLTLTRHDDGSTEPFDELRCGLDHVAFVLPSISDVEACERRFADLDVEHSDIRRGSGDMAVITVRDPDNIQLEVFAARR